MGVMLDDLCYDYFEKIKEDSPDLMAKNNITGKWLVNDDFYLPIIDSCDTLAKGFYSVLQDARGNTGLKKQSISNDEIIIFSDDLISKIVVEIDKFWDKAQIYTENKILHRRGIGLYGPHGNGKSYIIYAIINSFLHKHNGIVLNGNCKPAYLAEALRAVRRNDPERKVICIFEDIDGIIKDYGEEKLLAILDGEDKINHVLNIATTNKPELLDKRITARAKRFDRWYYIDLPNESIRLEYIKKKIPDLSEDQLNRYVRKTKGLSLSSLAEMIITIKCLDYDLNEALEILNGLQDGRLKESTNSCIGFYD